ncbi:MAG: DUF4422 domain-containing protein [Clostridiaceae bacterium]|nr:DUF4422 domain-containing protein [Clostridiaceae bacterium]
MAGMKRFRVNKMSDIKLFVCCHQPERIPEHPLLLPVQVGAAISDTHFPGFLYDDAGDNISEKNRSYCELTAQYWAWKNIQADYYGFFHYRRYLYPDIYAKRPYRIESAATLSMLERLNYSCFERLIPQYDLILPKPENMYCSVRRHYAAAPFHHQRDLALTEKILCMYEPSYIQAAETYLGGSLSYFGNIYIMQRDLFQAYCTWLFSILQDYDKQSDTSCYNAAEQRVDGYLAERLLGIYVEKLRERGNLSVLELPRVHFLPGRTGQMQKFVTSLLPPGTKRRAMIKRWFKPNRK